MNEPVKCLLVDDLEENLLALDALLRSEKVQPLQARSGAEALELLLLHDVALALVDVQMPGMDGFELAEYMRGANRTRHVPIIFLTAGSADRQRRFRGYEAGAVDFIQKPVEAEILFSKARVFFELYRQRQQVAQQRDELRVTTEENLRLLQETRQYAAALNEADRRKDEFLATLAHELRNPLAPIRNGLELLGHADLPAKNAREVRGMMERQLTHLVRLIDDLMDISRISKGKIELRRERMELQPVLGFAVETSAPLIAERGHRLEQDLPQEPLWVDADMNRLTQVISNLLNNAARYTPEGGRITLSLRRDGDRAVVSVRDTGVGISADQQQNIFDLFAQVENPLAQTQGGLGIGLALARHLVDLHGGHLQVESAGPGQGSCFSVQLPLAAEPQGQPADSKAATHPRKGLRVLVVDDNLASAQTTAMLLELLGFPAALAHDGEQALQLADELLPQVILLDIGLPGMDGYEVCARLRRDPRFAATLIIAQTGLGQERDREKARQAGFSHYLVKPVKIEEILDLLPTAAELTPR